MYKYTYKTPKTLYFMTFKKLSCIPTHEMKIEYQNWLIFDRTKVWEIE